jgi:hypothetical protein
MRAIGAIANITAGPEQDVETSMPRTPRLCSNTLRIRYGAVRALLCKGSDRASESCAPNDVEPIGDKSG